MATLFLFIYMLALLVADCGRTHTNRSSATFEADKNKQKDRTVGLDEIILLDILDEDNEDGLE